MNLADISKAIIIPLVVSAITFVGGLIYTSGTQRVLLEQNIDATKELSKAVIELRVEVAQDRGKYVTREELKAELKEIRRGT